MLFKIGSVLMLAWLLGVLGVYRIGDLVHMFFLVGGLFLLLALARARDAVTTRQRAQERSEKS